MTAKARLVALDDVAADVGAGRPVNLDKDQAVVASDLVVGNLIEDHPLGRQRRGK